MNCVNIKSRDFIHLAKRLNLSSNTLELIIHKYQAETGFDTAFPSDVYIQAQLGKDQYIEPSKAVRDLWEASYSTPQSFNSLQEYQRKYEEVKNYFPNEALVHYKDNENKDVLVVKKPVKELRPTINDYLDSDSHTKQEWDDYDFITRQLAANLKNNNNFAAANKIREQYVTDRKTEEGNTTFSHFDLKKPIKLKEKGIAADLKAIQANEWHLPEDIQKTVADKLQKYMDDKSGEIQEVDTVPYFGEKGKTNAKDILTYITKNSTDKDIKTLASFVLKNLGKNENVPVSFSNNTRGFRGKYYTISHSVRINKVSMTGNDVASAANNMEQTIIHEIAHAISVRAIETSPEIRKELLQIFKDYNQLKSQYGINTGYAAKNPKEFLAEFLGRKAFREALMALPSIGQENKKTKQTIGQRILNWLKNVLHIGNKSSFFKQADEVIQKVLDQANSQEFFYTDEMETAAEDRNPQPFTFNDGTVITAPFAPNKQQADALNAMNDFLNSNETTMTLSGYAGTGKTSLMEIIAQKARRQHKDIVFSATTNKAAAVLKSRVAKAGFDAQTLNKVFGINVEVDSSKAYNARNLVTALKEANVEPGTTVVIDEASMINEENYSILNRVARENSLKIIYVGDKAQLAPVNENQVSKVFRNSEGRIIELTKVERTDDNAILKEATNIRNGLPLSGESSFNERGEGVGYLTPKSREEVGRVIRHYIQGLKDNPNFFRILAYTNKAVTDYNNYVRSLLGYNDYVPHVGEPLTGYSNWGYEWRTKSYRFINSESYKVTKVGRPQTSSISINGENYTMQYVPITMENSLGETDTFNYMDVKGNQENRKAALQLATQKKTLWEQYRRAVGREAKSDILSQINSIDQFLFVNDNIEDPTTHNLLQPKTVDFGYALTIHKSQGSTFTHVLMDDIDVAKAGNTLNNAANAEDVYIGEDQWGASMDNMQGEAEEVDMGITEYDLNPAKYANPTTTTDNPNIANIRQQLEYVGVSRATNTVTIVATDANVKKEDSPLNHIKSSTNATPSVSQPVTIENTPKPADQMSKKELWEHLESLTEPIGERPVSYTPVGKTRQEYIVKDGKVYNKKGEEVHYQGKDMNKILANLAVAEDRGVVVTYRNNDYVVDNHQNITSVQTGDIMKWGPQDGNRKTIIQLAEQKFQTLIKNRQNRLSEMVPELMDLLKAQGINVNDKAAMEKFLKENPQWSTKIQQIIEENREMQSIKERAIADGTFMKAPNGNPTNLTERQWLQVRTKNFINWFGDWVNDPANASKVVDENGEPLVVYHGSKTLINIFDSSKSDARYSLSQSIKATNFFSDDKTVADALAQTEKQSIAHAIGKSLNEISESQIEDENEVWDFVANSVNKSVDWVKNFWLNELSLEERMDASDGIMYDTNVEKQKYHVFLNMRNPAVIDAEGKRADKVLEENKEIINNNDEVIILNVDETVGKQETATDYLVRKSNQIKSATDNNGMFSTENDDIQALQTSEGELYGFADPKGDLYFDEEKVSPNVQIHEYAHLWDRAVAQRNPKLWKRGVDLMKQTSLWNEVLNDANYGQKWQAVKGITSEKMESLIASEVHSRLTGTQGEALLNRIAKEKGSKGIIAKLKQWMLDFWKELKGTFSNWSDEEINNLTLDDFNKMTVRDLVDKINLKEQSKQSLPQQPQQQNNFDVSKAELYSGAADGSDKAWGAEARALGIKVTDYTRDNWNSLSQEWKNKLSAEYEEVAEALARPVILPGSRGDIEVRRDMMQADKADAIFAIGTVVKPGQRGAKYVNRGDHDVVDGGTGYATQRGIIRGIPVYVFDQTDNQWKVWNTNSKTFVTTSEPTLTPHAATIGTRDINDAGRQAIKNVLAKTVNQQPIQPAQQGQQQVVGENISSKGSEFAKRLTNPFNNETVEFRGTKFDNAEHAYQTWKSGKFDQRGFDAHGGKVKGTTDYSSNYQTMVEILTAKLQQHPDLVEGIAERGGEAYLKASTHDVVGDKYWETKTGQNKFIEALIEAYKSVTSQQSQQVPISEVSSSEQSPQRVSLLSYEYFMDKTEDTLVDAAWKVPMLQELDKQISTELTPEENNDILDRMTRILEAKNQEDLLNLLSDEPKTNEKVEQNLTEFEKMTQQINNLLDSNIISASEIRHVAELVVNSISDTITILQKEEGAAEKFFPNIQTDLDFKSASRKEIVEAIGINNLIHRAKQQFDPEQNDYEDFDTMEQADLIIDNWDAIMTLAADTFSMNEGFGIMRNYDKGGFATTQNSTVDFDNFNDYSNDPDAMAESEKDEQEHWQVEQRTIDILNSMSQMVRLALHECYQMDREGNKVMSKWGIAERINPRKAVNSILRWTQGSLTLEDMINKMQGKATQNPWLNQLIERLSDKSGNETDFQSQFFGVFSKHFQPYSVVLLEDGKYHSIPVNSHPALSEAMQTITTQFKIGEHPLFTDRGINRKLLGSDSTTNANSPFNLHQALAALNLIQDRLQHGEQLDNDMSKEAAANIMGVCRVMGYPITEEMLSDVINEENLSKMTTNLGFIVRSLDAAREEQFRNAGTPNAKVYNPFAFKSENGIAGSLRNFLTPITDTLEDTAVSAFYDSGKMYQSYVTPSFMTKLMNKFRLEGKEFEDFIMQEYGGTEWFKSAKNQWDVSKGWRNEWLRLLATDENARKVFDHKVELNFNKHNYMRNMSDAEYTLSLITEYFAETGQKKEALVPAWFRVPIMSNKPSSEFIKFYSYRGANYKDEIIYGLHQMFNQELSRIQTVNMRNRSKGDADFIANFDTNGRKFNFLPFLNRYLDANETSNLGLLLKKKINSQEALTAEEEARLSTMVDQAIRQDMEKRVATILNQWEKSGIIEAAKNIEGIGTEEAQIRANLENFLWNDNFASKNILQLTITDIAFYKDAEDLQKRLAQIHAPGIRGNVTATDYKGDRVSDGKYRTVLIQGLQKFKTDLIANIAEVFERKIAAAPEGQKAQLRALKESLVGEKGRYTKIDVTDGQAYSSPSSYRKKAFIFGKWSKHAEDIYQKLLKGDYNYSDLEVAFQPLKPFVYTHLQKNMGVDSAPIHQIPVPFQAKNSEYLLIMADALIKGEEAKSGKLSRPNILGAIYRIMEDSAYDGRTYDEYGNIKDYGTYNKRGIDTIQFDSAIKSGLQAPIDLNPFLDMESGEEAAYEHMKRMIYKSDDQGNPSNEYATDTYVHEGLYEDYCLQQEVPEHFKNHSQAHGSQIRMIIPSDLDFYKNPNADHNDPNNQVFYEWTEPDGTKKKLRADEFRREYEQTIADNIRESIDQLSQELHINSENKKERNIALSKILQREILSSPRYGIDLIQACSIDKETGEFRIPKGDPIQAKRIEQLINSIIKNRVNKQKIAGGPIVQVTNFGASRQLHIRFNSKEGGLLMTREEYEKNPQKKEMSQTDKFNARYGRKTASGNMTYEEYVKQNQAGIAYFEVFIPMWANEIFEKFSNEDGSINMEALEATSPELLKMISYRIPTEDKYSCAPMKAVGFLPREAGDAIMFPYELTEIDDSDFDVDKRYVMRKDFNRDAKGQIFHKKPKHIIHKELFDIVEESYKKQHDGKELPANIASEIEVFLDSPDTMRSKSTFTKWLYSQYQKIAYTTKAPTSGRKYRDNKIVDMTWAVLTNEMTADKILNPGGFDVFKRAGYMVAAYKNPANNYSWGQLQQMPIDKLNELSYTDKDLTWLDTQIQFYKQNAAASSLIGVFAVNKVAHATLESNDYYLAVNEICGDEPFIIAGTEFGGRMKIDPSHDSEGNLIGKTIGAGVSASADAAKTPVLNLMNINMTTAGIFNTLLRLGMAPNDASLFMSQEVIERILNEFNRENLTNYKPLSTIIGEHISDLRDKYKITDSSNINTEPISREELVEGLTPEEHEVIDYKVLLAFQKVRSLVDAIRKPTFATRFNSISSAVGPLIIDNLIMEHKMEQFRDVASENGTHIYDSEGNNVDIDDIFYDHPILREFSRTVDIAKVMFSDMPAGSTGFRELLATLPEGLSDKVYNDKKLLDNLSNFYQSYLLIASHMVNPANLKKFIDGFPKYFNDQKFKEKYADNALIQAIRMNVSKRTGRPFLSINITGIDESQKEVYRSAWIDLHKDNPELSKQLFEYCFFRAGVGFSPKTFMSLVPTYVKERLSKDLGNGSQATYVDTYRRFPSVNPNVVLDQWVRNNWDNNKLVPKKGGEDTHYIVDLKRGTLIAKDPKDMADLQDCTYIKTRHNGQTYLWKQIIADKTAVNYVMVKPLGNNAEYLEMSLSDITKPMSETKETIEDMQESELQTVSPAEADAAGTSTADNITDTEKVKRVSEFADLIMQQNPKLNKTQAMNLFEKMKEKPDLYAGFLVNVYKQKGLNLTKEEALAEFKKLC